MSKTKSFLKLCRDIMIDLNLSFVAADKQCTSYVESESEACLNRSDDKDLMN